MNCCKCNVSESTNVQIGICDKCRKGICQNCAQITATEWRCVVLKKRSILYLCPECRDDYESNKEIKQIISAELSNHMTEIINMLDSKLKDIKEDIADLKMSKEEPTSSTSYANIVKNNLYANKEYEKNRSEVTNIILCPKEKTETSKIKEDLKSKINPTSLKVGVTMGKTTKQGGMVLRCENKTAMETIKDKIEEEMGNKYEIKIPQKKNPVVKVIGIREEDDSDELMENIIKQNVIEKHEYFKMDLKKRTKSRNGRFDIIIEVDSRTFQKVTQHSKLKVGWSVCLVKEQLSIIRCYKCYRYGHMKRDCKNEITCPICAENHEENVCKKEESYKCINCIEAKQKYNIELDITHTVFDTKCKCYNKIKNIVLGRINYDMSVNR